MGVFLAIKLFIFRFWSCLLRQFTEQNIVVNYCHNQINKQQERNDIILHFRVFQKQQRWTQIRGRGFRRHPLRIERQIEVKHCNRDTQCHVAIITQSRLVLCKFWLIHKRKHIEHCRRCCKDDKKTEHHITVCKNIANPAHCIQVKQIQKNVANDCIAEID